MWNWWVFCWKFYMGFGWNLLKDFVCRNVWVQLVSYDGNCVWWTRNSCCFYDGIDVYFAENLMWVSVEIGEGVCGPKLMILACELWWKILCVELKIYARIDVYFAEKLRVDFGWKLLKDLVYRNVWVQLVSYDGNCVCWTGNSCLFYVGNSWVFFWEFACVFWLEFGWRIVYFVANCDSLPKLRWQ